MDIKLILLTLGFLAPYQALGQAESVTSSIDHLTETPSLLSTEHRPISVFSIPATKGRGGSGETRFLIQGGLHGDEVLTIAFVQWLRDRLVAGISPLNSLGTNVVFDLVPRANPDRAGSGRYNARKVNLNRNFGIHWGISREPMGSQAFSEAETRALKALLLKRRYLAAIDVHGYANWLVIPSAQGLSQIDPEQRDRYNAWQEAAHRQAKGLGSIQRYEVRRAIELGDGGAFEDWAYWGSGTLALCLEMARNERFTRNSRGGVVDSFLVYESFIGRMFQDALKLDSTNRTYQVRTPREADRPAH